MRTKLSGLGGTIAVLALAFSSSASADTLGSIKPSGANGGACFASAMTQLASDPSTPYTVPAGGGQITQWQVDTSSGATAGGSVTLVVLKAAGVGSYTVVATDHETLPTPLPASNIASFNLASPISVTGGETLALATPSAATCYWSAGGTPTADQVVALNGTVAPGQTLTTTSPSPGGFTLNVAATLNRIQDVGVTTSVTPSTGTVGNLGLLASSVTNGGAGQGPITFTDNVPAGLTIDAAGAGSGTCTTSGQQVTCTITGLPGGQTTAVNIVVTPTIAQTFTNSVSVAVASGGQDPNPANNNASASWTVSLPPSPPPPRCNVPSLAGTPRAVAEHVLVLLSCKVGKVTLVHSKAVAKGAVIRTLPGAGAFANGNVIALQVSSGPKRPKPKHKHGSKHH
jgi:hypothetical protein